MTNQPIYFEKAIDTDLHQIWHLLLADSKLIKEEELLAQMNDIYVLRFNNKILGALSGTYVAGKVNIIWTVIHPIYPEKELRDAMIYEYTAILCFGNQRVVPPWVKFGLLRKWREMLFAKPLIRSRTK